ncbi:MAG TPA: hypothetical protein ENK18_23585 [Deltaproteobacteria bacterium]|nr:hypothetical protein [Deltaproteobacteria bacterium]
MDPVHVLLEVSDPCSRAQAHTALGARALERHDLQTAVAHLQEAIALDPEQEHPQRLLASARARGPRRRRLLPFL